MYKVVAERERTSRRMTSGHFSKLQCRESNLYIQNFRFEKRRKKAFENLSAGAQSTCSSLSTSSVKNLIIQ
jgi:hypothetical protein